MYPLCLQVNYSEQKHYFFLKVIIEQANIISVNYKVNCTMYLTLLKAKYILIPHFSTMLYLNKNAKALKPHLVIYWF